MPQSCMSKCYLYGWLLLPFLCACQSKPPAYQLVWAEEFNYTGLPDPTIWSFEEGDGCPNLCGWGNNEVQYYTRDQLKNARVTDGTLVLEAHREDGTGLPFSSARLITKGKQAWEFGRFEFRAKLPKGAGTWPALWLLSTKISDVGWPDCGEIDVMEYVGRTPGTIHGSLHSPSSFGATENTGTISIPDVAETFHVYTVEWTPDSIAFFVDNRAYYTYAPTVKDASTWPFTGPYFIILNIAMGGNFGSDPAYETNGLKNGVDSLLQVARMEVDYIRVYQKQ